jgi:hypothetical protein
VKRHIAIRRQLAIMVIAGLSLAPVSRPVMAETASDVSMQAMADEMSPSSAAADEMAKRHAVLSVQGAGADRL